MLRSSLGYEWSVTDTPWHVELCNHLTSPYWGDCVVWGISVSHAHVIYFVINLVNQPVKLWQVHHRRAIVSYNMLLSHYMIMPALCRWQMCYIIKWNIWNGFLYSTCVSWFSDSLSNNKNLHMCCELFNTKYTHMHPYWISVWYDRLLLLLNAYCSTHWNLQWQFFWLFELCVQCLYEF